MPSPLPLLVLLPGMDGTGLMFGPFVKALGDWESKVVRYPPELTSYEDCTAFARKQVPVDRPFLLLGESFSGPVAIALAAENPPGLQGLVLCSTFARNPRPNLGWLAPLVRLLPAPRLPKFLLRRLLLRRPAPEALLRLVDLLLDELQPRTMKRRLLAVGAVDHTDLLVGVPVPILVLSASQDRLVPEAATRWMREHRALDAVRLQGPHWLLQARPKACMRAIREFLGRAGSQPGGATGR
jgi:pimeloyl-[acyl-carrier protein] methyl ester esterase